MKNSKYCIWIDDSLGSRKDRAERFCAELSVALKFINTTKDNIGEEISKINDDTRPEVIFLDHYLARNKEDLKLFSKGFSFCSLMRLRWSDVPIIGITAAKSDSISASHINEYSTFIESRKLGDEFSRIKSIISGFQALKNIKRKPYFSLLDAPEIDREILQKCIYPDFLEKDKAKVDFHQMYKWLDSIFFKRSGFLLNIKYAATLLGLKESSFKLKIMPLLKKCFYSGIFADEKNPLFWKKLLIGEIVELVQDDKCTPNNYLGELVPGVKKSDIEICAVCRKTHPEILAREDRSTSARLLPVHRFCAQELEEDQILFFDPIYLIN